MTRRFWLALPVCLAFVSVCAAGIGTNRFTLSVADNGRVVDYVAVRKGRLTLGRSTFGAVSDNHDAADRWYVAGCKIKSSVGGGYLAYDPTGKSSRVFLSPEPGEGTDWLVGIGGRADEGKRGAVQAASGPLRGWYLDVSEEDEQETADGRTHTRRVPVLSRAPSHKVEAERIWEHK